MSGYVIPAGVPILVDGFVAGRAEENFSRPEQYIPERWLKTEQEILPHDGYASLPFSFGPRMCLGRRIAELQICTLVAKILLKYNIEYPREELEFHGQLINIPKDHTDFSFKMRRPEANKSSTHTPREIRHHLFISKFSTGILHIRGGQNIPADTLSRMDAVTSPVTPAPLDVQTLTAHKANDPDLKKLRSS
ncbi:hypothetical protein MRX96_058666 [Rhipicephalus microplus]